MLHQDAFDLGRAHPRTTDLEHVVGPAIEPVVTLVVLMKLVTSRNPMALDGLFGFVLTVPITCANRIALDPQIANFARRYWLPLVVQDFHFTAGNGASARTGSYCAGRIGNKDMQSFR